MTFVFNFFQITTHFNAQNKRLARLFVGHVSLWKDGKLLVLDFQFLIISFGGRGGNMFYRVTTLVLHIHSIQGQCNSNTGPDPDPVYVQS